MRRPEFDLEKAHKYFAPTLNVECWTLLDRDDRTEEDDRKMLMAAFASNYHWLYAGDDINQQRGEWLIAKVYAALGDGANCLRHALRCMEWTDNIEEGLTDFDLAYAHEMLARGYAMTGDKKRAKELKAKARKLGKAIEGEEDRKIFEGDLAWGDWNGVD